MKASLASIVLSSILFLLPHLGLTSPIDTSHLFSLREMLPRDSHWGLIVIDLRNGKETISLGNPDGRLAPASLMKLFTAGSALEMEAAGKQLPLTTDILHDGRLDGATLSGNVYLRGNGNCLLSADDLKKTATYLKEKGIGRVTGQGLAANVEGLLRKEPPWPPNWVNVMTSKGLVRAIAFTLQSRKMSNCSCGPLGSYVFRYFPESRGTAVFIK